MRPQGHARVPVRHPRGLSERTSPKLNSRALLAACMNTSAMPAAPSPLMLLMVPAAAVLFAAVGFLTVGADSLYAVGPPAAALLLGAAIVWPAVREAVSQPEAFGRALILATMPETSLLFGFIAAFTLAGPQALVPASPGTLALVGVAGAVAIGVQSLLLRAKIAQAVTREGFGRFLPLYVLPSLLTLSAFVVAFTR